MGDRFYTAQKDYKPKRVLKKDIIADINSTLQVSIAGLDKCTIDTLNALYDAITKKP